MSEQIFSAAERRRSLAAIILGMFAVGVYWGMFTPGIALILESRGFSSSLIGLNSAMQPLAMLLFGAFVYKVAGRLGTLRAFVGGIGLAIAALALMPFTTDIVAWCVLRFLIGTGLAMPWLVTETWINSVATESARGRTVAAYSAAFYGGLASGPLLFELVGVDLLFPVAVGLLALAGLPVILNARLAPSMPARPKLRLLDAVRKVPLVAAAALLAGFTETAVLALFPIYGLRSGLGETQSVILLSAFTAGAILLQLPMGALSDRINRRKMLVACVALNLVCLAVLPLALDSAVALWPLVCLWGGFVLGFYTLGLALLGERFSAAELSVANALFIICYEAGGASGPILTGIAMSVAGPEGFPASLATLSLGFLALAWIRSKRKAALRKAG